MTPNNRLWKILDKRRFLIAAMQELAGTARISFEGDLSATGVSRIADASGDETRPQKKHSMAEARIYRPPVGARPGKDNHFGYRGNYP